MALIKKSNIVEAIAFEPTHITSFGVDKGDVISDAIVKSWSPRGKGGSLVKFEFEIDDTGTKYSTVQYYTDSSTGNVLEYGKKADLTFVGLSPDQKYCSFRISFNC